MRLKTDILVIGCGITGAVIARRYAEAGRRVTIWERRDHIGGNMRDYVDAHGFLVHQYGPHSFHTTKRELYDYICRFETWTPYRLTCGASWGKSCVPTPFDFHTIDAFYPVELATRLKEKIASAFGGRKSASVLEVLSHPDPDIHGYAEFLFKNDYAPYTAKQWGLQPEEIDPSVLERVPLRFSYGEGYFDDEYQVMPGHSYTTFFENLLNHPNITVELKTDARERLSVRGVSLLLDGERTDRPIIYTGALDELFGCAYGRLPYRSLRFEWRYAEENSVQPYPIVAYPQEKEFTRVTEYSKLPPQDGKGSSYALEYPLPYREGESNEPYYPVLTEASQKQYARYRALAERVPNLTCCGRLADFKYYNMDQALERALEVPLL